jgi:Zn-dependent protease/CBS domain-containing protein
MKWSWRIGKFLGIDVYMHVTFLLLIGWVVVSYYLQGSTLAATAEGVLFILALFACVVLHEYGHALTARRYGIKTRDITLLPIGGLARLEKMPDEPSQELRVALAGPAVNVVIAAALFAALTVTSSVVPLSSLSLGKGSFVEQLMVVNVFLVLFNMIPAFPMDGGRVVRALLAMRMEYTRATQVAASLGQSIAFIFGFIGLFTNPFLLFIAFFVWIGAHQEASMTQMKTSLAGIPVSRAMLTEFHSLTPDTTLSQVIELVLSGSQQDFPVVNNGQVVGVLTRGDLVKALHQQGQGALVSDVMHHDFEVIDSYEMLEVALPRLQKSHHQMVPVVRFGQLVGLLTTENVGEFLMIQAALRTA